ncbi:MAG: amino-acid N-acetyltransferase [Canibacter sp.]
MTQAKNITIRQARTKDVWRISELMDPLVAKRILLGKDKVVLFESVPEFLVAEDERGSIIGYGALHVLWEHLGEIRTLGVSDEARGTGVGHLLLEALEERAQQFGLTQLFCLTFEVNFFIRHGFEEMSEDDTIVAADVYAELLRSTDEGIAEFLDLARVKPNTLGNTRMLKQLR